MKIVVCIKQVPENAQVAVSPQLTMVREGISLVINPADANALEAALQLKDRYDASVTVLSMGKPSAESMLRQLAPLGADRLVLVSDPAFSGSDTYATALVLSRAIRYLGGADMILCGRRAIDGETGQVGPEIAAMLDTPCITNCLGISGIEDGTLSCTRLSERERQTVLACLPALLTVCEWINSPRLPSIFSLRHRADIPAELLTNRQLGIPEELCGLKGSPTQVKKMDVRRDESKNPSKYRDADQGAKAAAELIRRTAGGEAVS